MTTALTGTIVTVDSERIGSHLAQPVGATAAGELWLNTAVDFNPDGGALIVADEPDNPIGYAEADHHLGRLTLAVSHTWAGGLPEGMPVFVHPEQSETIAHVVTDNPDGLLDTVEPLRALVPYTMRAVLPEGVRPTGAGEVVRLEVQGGRLVVADVLRETPPGTVADAGAALEAAQEAQTLVAGVIADVQALKTAGVRWVGADGKPPALTTAGANVDVPATSLTAWGATAALPAVTVSGRYYGVRRSNLSPWQGATYNPATDLVLVVNNGGVGVDVQNSDLVDGSLIVNGTVTAQAFQADLVLASKLMTAPVTQPRLEVAPGEGFVTYAPSPEGGTQVSSRFGGLGVADFLQVMDGSEVVASIDQAGGVVARTTSLGRSPGDVYVNGQPFEDYFDALPQGLNAWGMRETNGGAASAETRWLEVQTVLSPGRMYRLTLNPTYLAGSQANNTAVLAFRYAIGGVAVSLSSTQIQSTRVFLPLAGQAFPSNPMTVILNTGSLAAATEHRFLTSYLRNDGSGTVTPVASPGFPSIITVEDLGLSIPNVGIDFGAQAPPVTRQNYTTYWKSNASASYRGGGARRTDDPADTGGDMMHGLDPSGFNGNNSSVALFTGGSYHSTNTAEVGKTVSAALSGATINSVEVMLTTRHTYYSAGATVYYLHGTMTSLPSTYVNPATNYYGSSYFQLGQSKYVPLPKQVITSVTLGQAPGGAGNYARLAGATQGSAPVLKINYTR